MVGYTYLNLVVVLFVLGSTDTEIWVSLNNIYVRGDVNVVVDLVRP